MNRENNKTDPTALKKRFGIIGNAKLLNKAVSLASKIAPTSLNILISGENGSGKESFSKIIHELSNQRHGPLIAINCGSIPEGTIDSELFGHEKGAFTGAFEKRQGYFQEATRGTLFLDEIGEMPLSTQARLLRVLEYGEFLRVGSSKIEKTDARIIAATHVNLKDAVSKGKFREDLFYRLNTLTIKVPPLRERGDDILLLFKKFAIDVLDQHGIQLPILTSSAEKLLLEYPFPGNIRELKNLVVRIAFLLPKYDEVTAQRLEPFIKSNEINLPNKKSSFLESNISKKEDLILYQLLKLQQRDLLEIKKLIFELLNNEPIGCELISRYPNLFDSWINTKESSNLFLDKNDQLLEDNIEKVDIEKKKFLLPNSNLEQSKIQPSKEIEPISLELMERKLLEKTLDYFNGNRKKVATALEIPERTLYRKLKKHNL